MTKPGDRASGAVERLLSYARGWKAKKPTGQDYTGYDRQRRGIHALTGVAPKTAPIVVAYTRWWQTGAGHER